MEHGLFRYKTILGHAIRTRSLAGQQVDFKLARLILNTMAGQGMPENQKVA